MLSHRRNPLSSRYAVILFAGSVHGLVWLSSCSSGSSSGSGNASAPNGAVSDVTIAPLGVGRFRVKFKLTADTKRELGVDLEYSEDRGGTFRVATIKVSPTAPLTRGHFASKAGLSQELTWDANADLTSFEQHDLVLRVTPYDLRSGATGSDEVSSVFGVGTNTEPDVDTVSTPATTVGGWIAFDYVVTDAQGDHVGVDTEYSTDGGVTYRAATLGQGDGTMSLETSPAGVPHRILWHAQGDVPEAYEGDVRSRIRAHDIEAGSFRTSSSFAARTYAPRVDLLTVNGLPDDMNGSSTYRSTSGKDEVFNLLVPETGFEIWIEYSLHPSGSTVDSDGFEISNSNDLGGGSGSGGVDADTDFGNLLAVDAGSGIATLKVTPGLEFFEGQHVITASVRDVLGNVSESVSYVFETSEATALRRPFENQDVWLVDFGRDNFTTVVTVSESGAVTLSTTMTPNEIADFVEDLRILGLSGVDMPQEAEDAGLNAIVRDIVIESIVGRVNTYFGREFDGTGTEESANVRFVIDPAEEALSRIAVGGDDPVPGFTIGRAEFDYRNSNANDNTDADLGVFTTNLIDFYINSSFTFKDRFDDLIPGRGTPVGFDGVDVTVLDASFDRFDAGNTAEENARYDAITDAVDAFSRAVATILAHEIGHSLGLVANGAPPRGLFGGEFNASFTGPYTTTFHLDTSANDIMAAALSFSGSLQIGTNAPAFSFLNMAYLREQILLD